MKLRIKHRTIINASYEKVWSAIANPEHLASSNTKIQQFVSRGTEFNGAIEHKGKTSRFTGRLVHSTAETVVYEATIESEQDLIKLTLQYAIKPRRHGTLLELHEIYDHDLSFFIWLPLMLVFKVGKPVKDPPLTMLKRQLEA